MPQPKKQLESLLLLLVSVIITLELVIHLFNINLGWVITPITFLFGIIIIVFVFKEKLKK